MTSKIAIVILNWNGKALLERFLPSVVMHSKEATIYVADNASTDDSVQYIKNNFSTVKIILNEENGGYAKGYNDALQSVEENFLCLLNNDIKVTKNWLEPILNTFIDNEDLAIIQPKLLDYKKPNYFEYAGATGGFIDKYGFPYCRGRIFNTIEKDTNQYNKSTSIFWASGACFFVRNKVFKELNGFDASFFAHMEEIDFCWRAQNKGYNVAYIPESTVYHLGGGTLKSTNPKKTYLNFRNSLLMLVKNTKKPIFRLLFTRLCIDGIAGMQFALKLKFKHTLAIIRAHFSFYSKLSSVLKQRKKLQQNITHYTIKSIVWSYFIKRKKHYSKLH